MTLKDTPTIVTAAGVAGLEFTDEVATANALVPVLRQQGVNAIVVLIHQGGRQARRPGSGRTTSRTGQPVLRRRVRQRLAAGTRLADHPDRQGPRPGHRHGRLRSHPRAVRVRHQGPGRPGPARHLGVVLRPALHRDQPQVRPAHSGHRPRLGRGLQPPRHAQRRRRTRRRRRSSATYKALAIAPIASKVIGQINADVTRGRRTRPASRRSAISSPTPSSPTRRSSSGGSPAGRRVHEPRRHPGRPHLRSIDVGRGAGRRHLRGGVHGPAVQQLPRVDGPQGLGHLRAADPAV